MGSSIVTGEGTDDTHTLRADTTVTRAAVLVPVQSVDVDADSEPSSPSWWGRRMLKHLTTTSTWNRHDGTEPSRERQNGQTRHVST